MPKRRIAKYPLLEGVAVEVNVDSVAKRSRLDIVPASEEQMRPIECLRAMRANVIVDAIPGSGKSASILNLARACPDKTILQLTYNSALALELTDKIKIHGIDNLTVCTYHSLYVTYYDKCCFTDMGIRKIVALNSPPKRPLLRPDIFITDETQDQTQGLCVAAYKYLLDAGKPFIFGLFGDVDQGIFGFRGADPRFLTFADKIWEKHPFLLTTMFERFSFHTSYRLTHQMAWFVNNVLLGEEKIRAVRNGPKVSYVRMEANRMVETIVKQIISLIKRNNFAPSDIFVISDSIATNTRLKEIANQLVMQNIPVFAEFNERGDRIDDSVMKGKVVFTTIHASKGRERPIVIVAKFDNSSNRDGAFKCPPTQFVQTTRASTFMYIFESASYFTKPFTFLKLTHGEMQETNAAEFVQFTGKPYVEPVKPLKSSNSSLQPRYSPSSLVKFVSDQTLHFISIILDTIMHSEELSEDGGMLDFCSIAPTANGGFEDVSDLNGVALPAMFYDQLYRQYRSEEENDTYCTLKHEIAIKVSDLKPPSRSFLQPKLDALSNTLNSISDYLHHANVLKALNEGLYFRLHQMSNYNWLRDEEVSRGCERMSSIIGPDCDIKTKFEVDVVKYSDGMYNTILNDRLKEIFERHDKEAFLLPCVFEAWADIVSSTTVWEIKCVSQLTVDHMVQLCVYAWIWRSLDKPEKQFKLYNVKTHTMMRLDASLEQLDDIMFHLIYGKDMQSNKLSDEEFLQSTLEVLAECKPCESVPEAEVGHSHKCLL